MVLLALGVLSNDGSALELLAVLRPDVPELTTKCDVLLLACVKGIPTSSSSRAWKKLAFEAVIGVLGVFGIICAEGVWALRAPSSSRSFSASILVAIGVPRGSRLRGGSFKGCRFFFETPTGALGLASGVFIAFPAECSDESSPVL